jgi:hypothetical protein
VSVLAMEERAMAEESASSPEATKRAATPVSHDIPRTCWTSLSNPLSIALSGAVPFMRFVSA